MRRLLLPALTLATLATLLTLGETQPYGGYVSFARRFIRLSAPPTCNATTAGFVYYDTDDNTFQGCDSAAWAELGGAGGITELTGEVTAGPGAGAQAATIARSTNFTWTGTHIFNGLSSRDLGAGGVGPGSVGTLSSVQFEGDIADAIEGHIVYFDGSGDGTFRIVPDVDNALQFFAVQFVPAATSRAVTAVAATVNAMDGSDSVQILQLELTNANHTGASNTLDILQIPAMTGDANANLNAINIGVLTGTAGAAGEVETAITIGTGWDRILSVAENSIIGGSPAAGDNSFVLIGPTTPILGAGNTLRVLNVLPTSVDHTGGTLLGLTVANITGDTQAVENAITIGTGWDLGIDGLISLSLGADGTIVLLLTDPVTSFGGGLGQVTNNIANVGGALLPLFAMDSSGDVTNLLLVNALNADHTAGTLNGLNVGGITGDAQATENGILIGSGWDFDINLTGTSSIAVLNVSGATAIFRLHANNDTTSAFQFRMTAGAAGEFSLDEGADLAVVGAAQNVDPTSNIVEIGAAAGASVSTISFPTVAQHTEMVTFVCKDANVTFNDSDAAGAANTIDLAGVATNFVCSQDDVITFVAIRAPGAGNARWMEVGRSVN